MNHTDIALFFAGSLWGGAIFAAANHYISVAGTERAPLLRGADCRFCGARLPLPVFIPFVGFFLGGRRCRNCGKGLPLLIPVMQGISGAAMPLVHHAYGFTGYAASVFLVLSAAAAVTAVDLRTFRVPDRLVILFFLFSLPPVLSTGSWKEGLLGTGLFSVFFLVIMFLFPGSFGGGDLKYGAAMGFFLGFEYSLVALEFSLVSGTIAGVAYVVATKKNLRSRIPFAPFLTAGMVLSLFFGREIVLFYLNRFF